MPGSHADWVLNTTEVCHTSSWIFSPYINVLPAAGSDERFTYVNLFLLFGLELADNVYKKEKAWQILNYRNKT